MLPWLLLFLLTGATPVGLGGRGCSFAFCFSIDMESRLFVSEELELDTVDVETLVIRFLQMSPALLVGSLHVLVGVEGTCEGDLYD